jgi:hypothetical protein
LKEAMLISLTHPSYLTIHNYPYLIYGADKVSFSTNRAPRSS